MGNGADKALVGALEKRRAVNLRTNLEVMRARISFTIAFDRILAVEQQLLDFAKPTLVFDQAGGMTAMIVAPDATGVASLKVVLDSCWKKINKQLPDLKPVDVIAALEEDQDITSRLLNPIEMRRRVLRHLLETAEVPPDPPEPSWMK